MTRSTWRHGRILLNVGVLLKLYAKSHEGWSVSGGDPGAKLQQSPDTLRGPDVAMVRKERVPTGTGVEGWLDGAPDVVAEVAGDAQSTASLVAKALEYLTAGSAVVWVVDPDAERVMVFTPPDHVRVLGRDDTLDGGTALPGFSCLVAEFFED